MRLTFFEPSTDSERHILDNDYKPYFFTSHPLNPRDQDYLDDLSAKTRLVEKKDLFTGHTKRMLQIELEEYGDTNRISRRFVNSWEGEISPVSSYIYDHDLVFGARHLLRAGRPKLDSYIPEDLNQKFEETFSRTIDEDPLKFSLLKRWFALCSQPIPQLSKTLLGLRGTVDPQKYSISFILSRVANLSLPTSLSSNQVSIWIKSILHNYLRKNNILIPTSKEFRKGERPRTVKGALTYPPVPGVYFDTYVVDFESLYPSIIDVRNLSYETINCSHQKCQINTVPGLNYYVCTEKRGIYSVLIGSIKDLRIRWFKILAKDNGILESERRQAQATSDFLKLILVSSYGVTIRIHGLACPPLAESITAYGRHSLRTSWNMAVEMGLHPVYGDTDSLFLDNPLRRQVELLIREVRRQLQLDLVIDEQYSLCVLPKAMKAYFGIRLDGTPDLKGIVAMKSNTPLFIQRVFENCIRELANSKNFEDFRRSKERVQMVVENSIKRLVADKVPLNELQYSVKIHEDPRLKMVDDVIHQPYQCAIQLIDLGRVLRKGDLVSFVKVKPFIYQGKTFTVKPIEIVKKTDGYEANVEDYIRNLRTALNQTFKILDLRFDQKDSKKSRESVTLSDFV